MTTTDNHERPLRRAARKPPPLRVAVSAQGAGARRIVAAHIPNHGSGRLRPRPYSSQPDESDQPFTRLVRMVGRVPLGRWTRVEKTAEHSQPLSPVAWRADHQLMVATKGPMRQTHHHCRVGPLFCVFSQRRGMARACDPS